MTGRLPLLLIIVGPTGSGKSRLAITLARKFQGELVSADSRQIYVGMSIGTAKLKPPTKGVRQWLVDVVRPDESFTLQEYQRRAIAVIKDIHRRGKLPILVGGTGLYIEAVAENWKIPRVRPHLALRRELERDLKTDGLAALTRRLRRLDFASARRIDIKNPRRVIRALEVALATGQSFVTAQKKGEALFDVLKIGLTVDRVALRQRLRSRAEAMVRRGLVAETRRLLRRYDPMLPAMSGIGYAEAAAYLQGELTREQLVERIATRSMQYARRQMTWWKRDKKILWIKNQEAIRQVSGFIKI